ncbi:phage major capsid protein [Anaerotignum sp. MB30-C6]|uniref:phage major capsid protein n=1 Tax=Anaerotignum sp. MB30-C6 TaxID=3070814 RepID=UPI0027DD2560|nr:phage major capsid protein [Anaerotignum sp. MB30-C6]WMI81591.1 phage major capsid protein [Anaerotignum sp. MB30-C6]
MKYIKMLEEKRAGKLKEMEAVLEKAKVEERAMTEEETGAFEDLEKEISGIDATIKVEERARGREKFEKKKEDETPEQLEERAFVNFVLNNQVELRAGEIQLTQGGNGSIVPTSIAKKIIKAVRDMVPFLQLADVVSTNGNLSVPVYGEDATNYINADYVSEGTDLTDNVGKFTSIDLTGYVIGALALVSNKLANNTDVDVVSFIVNQVAEAMAEKLEEEFVNGTATKITGILSAAKGITTASSTAITYDELVSLKHSLKQRFRSKGVLIMNPETYTAICKLKDNNGQPYFKEDEYKILGQRVIESDSMPTISAGAKAIAFADLSGYTIKETTAVEVRVLREKFSTKNMLGILAFGEFDAKITDVKKVAVLTMKTA